MSVDSQPSERPRSRAWGSLALAAIALVLAGCAATATVSQVESSEDVAAPSTEPLFELRGELPLSTTDVNGLVQFIEEETGRPFLRPPVIVAQTPEEFALALTEDVLHFEEDAEIAVRSMQALGLTTSGVDQVATSFTNLLTSPAGVQGYYDPESDELYVPVGALGDDDFRSLLVHELTHALDGQYANLNALESLGDEAEISGDWEPVIALQAVAEGRAVSVQNQWMREMRVSPAEPADLDAIDAVPPALIVSLSIPYAFGEQYIEDRGGAAETWDLLDNPPPSSEEFMVLGGITPGQEIVEVPAPDAAGPVLDEVVYGAADMFIWLLGESLEFSPDLYGPTVEALDGWAGGRAVLWGDDAESCMRIALAGDTADELADIRRAVDLWVQGGPNRSVETDGDLVVATGCAPFAP